LDNASVVAGGSITLSARGTAASGTISKVTFNFGDNNVQDVTSGNGIGTTSVTAQLSHIYRNPGTYTATATLYDTNGNSSNASSCSQTLSVTSQVNNPIPSTGPSEMLVGAGIAGVGIAVLGSLLLFGL
jgi:PKD repeat protein